MAKKKTAKKPVAKSNKPNKAAAVRDYVRQHPEASNNEVVAGLKSQNITITPNYVSVIKRQDRARQTQSGTTTRRGRGATLGAGVGIDEIKLAANLIRVCGSLEGAKLALNTANEVARALDAGR